MRAPEPAQRTGVAALDVKGLFHADICAKPGLRNDEAILAHELQRNLVGDNGGVAVGYVREGPRVDENGCALESLHEGGLDGVLHEHRQRTADTEVVRVDCLAAPGRGDDHLAEPLTHVPEARGEREHRHDLRGDGDVITRFPFHALLRRALAHSDLPKEPIIHIHNAVPGDLQRIDIQASERRLLLRCEAIGV